MAYQTLSNITAILKKIVLPEIYSTFNDENVLYQKIKKNSGVNVANNKIYAGVRSRRHSGVASVAEGTNPPVGRGTYLEMYTNIAYTFGTLGITDQALRAAGDSKKALAAALTTETESLKDSFLKQINRQFFGKGDGELATAASTQSSSTTLDLNEDVAFEYFAPGDEIEIGSTSATVDDIVDDNTLTLTSAVGWTAGDSIKKANAAEMMGLRGLVDDGTEVSSIQSVTRSTEPYVNSYVDDTSEAMSLSALDEAYFKVRKYGKIDMLIGNGDMIRKIGQLLTATLQYNVTDRKPLHAGWVGDLAYRGNIPILLDDDCPAGYLFGIDSSSFTIAEANPALSWLAGYGDQGILIRSASNRTEWEATLSYYANLFGKKFKGNFKLMNKTTA